ncbi:MAG: DNA polymerase III subunit gamma/tau [Candidatus Saccharibacteria bacterium]|nr:DNA polymerase III subunit gamma/tau [Candidatus Saccharibacteria bacterium]
MAKALYRKYRPCKLCDIVGQEQVTDVLSNSLKQGRISHAYLFIGPRGTGKTSVARIFAHEVNDFPYEIEDDYVDIIEIDGASNRGIDNIRELREKAAIAPTTGKYKVYIIDEVHMLTKEAFNALLKTLEEPPEHVIFIMATTDAYKVPVTITSRAQTYTFRLADSGVMLEHLKNIAKLEGIKIDGTALKIIVKRGGGSFRDSLSLLDQISTLSEDLITVELVEKAMGLPQDDKIRALIEGYISGNLQDLTTTMRELISTGIKPETIAEEMILGIIESPRAELMGLLSKLTEVKAPFAEAKLLVTLSGAVKTAVPAMTKPQAASIGSAPAEKMMEPEKQGSPEIQTAPDSVKKDEKAVGSQNFDWEKFCGVVRELNDAVAAQLMKCKHSISGNELDLFPDKKITRTILSRDNNKRILTESAGGIKVIIHEAGEIPAGEKKDELISKISDIMGGEVKSDGGDNPF